MACNIADGVTHRRSWLITRFSLSGCARDWWRCGRVRRDRRSALEVLRIPLEDGEIRLARRDGLARYPARFQLVLASNLCPCAPADPRHCICAPVAELTSEPRWAFGAGVGDGNASVLSRASMVDEPSTLKIELIYWPATTSRPELRRRRRCSATSTDGRNRAASNKDSWGARPTNPRLHGKPGSVNPLGYPPTQGRRKAQREKKIHRETGGGVCGHGKMVRSVQKSQLLIEQTEEFVSHLFDAGHLTEAKRLAVTLRVQLHHGLNGYF
jgi:hypothetical protein